MTLPLDVLRVFADERGEAGNPLGVFLDPVPAEHRQVIAADLGFSETVFFDDRAAGVLRIFTPAKELPLAGHPLVGAAWLLGRDGTLRPPAGEVPVRVDGAVAWIRAPAEWAPDWKLVELETPEAVDRATPRPQAGDYVWAWADRAAGQVRARCFAEGHGVREDEATGSAAMRLVAHLARPLTIHQGRGSVIHARPAEGGRVAIGGRVVRHGRRAYEEPASTDST